MRTNGTIDENEETTSYRCSPRPVGIHRLSGSGTRRAGQAPEHLLDHFPCVTLTERVVDFLERYNKAIYGLG
jgi:hypothetical protein